MLLRHCFLLLLLTSSFVLTQAFAQADKVLEIVETIPVETNLDNPDIRNTVEVWLELINGAKSTLEFEQFYISPQAGEPLDTILTAIIQAASRNVKVRFIVDARMYKTYPVTVDSLRRPNIDVRVIDFGKLGKLAGGVQHSKFFIVDGKKSFIGSQNFDWRALKHIHELGLYIRHAEVTKFYRDIFELDWKLAEKNDSAEIRQHLKHTSYQFPLAISFENSDHISLTPTASPKTLIPDTMFWDEPHLRKLIDGAQQEVLLNFLSYSNIGRDKSQYDTLHNAMKRAAARGVKVRLMVSDWEKGSRSDAPFKELTAIPNIVVKFMVIPEWTGGYVSFARVGHSKYICVDGKRFWLGTSNGEKSYFYTARNLGLIVENSQLAQRLQSIFMKSWNSIYSEEVRPDVVYEEREHGERK